MKEYDTMLLNFKYLDLDLRKCLGKNNILHLRPNIHLLKCHRLSPLAAIEFHHADKIFHPKEMLGDPQKQYENEPSKEKSHKTSVQVMEKVFDIQVSQFPEPCVKGDMIAISTLDDEYLAGVEACKHNLHGRIIWPKRSVSKDDCLKEQIISTLEGFELNEESPLWEKSFTNFLFQILRTCLELGL